MELVRRSSRPRYQVAYTAQLRDYVAWAHANKYTFDLYTRATTQLSGPLQDAVATGVVNQDCSQRKVESREKAF